MAATESSSSAVTDKSFPPALTVTGNNESSMRVPQGESARLRQD